MRVRVRARARVRVRVAAAGPDVAQGGVGRHAAQLTEVSAEQLARTSGAAHLPGRAG